MLTDDDKQWIADQLAHVYERLERVETTLLTGFHKWASPNGGAAMSTEPNAVLKHLHERIDRQQADFTKLREIVSGLEDAMIVQAHLEKRQSDSIVEHAERIARTERNLAEMTDKVHILLTYVMRRDNLPEAPDGGQS